MRHRSDRQPQSQAKHHLLARYLTRWAAIILNGPIARAGHRVHAWHTWLCYVDTCAYRGAYAGDAGAGPGAAPVFGSPVLGIQALDRAREGAGASGLPVSTVAVLFERDPATFAALVTTLCHAGYGARLEINPPDLIAAPGKIIAINDDYLSWLARLQRLLATQYMFSFVLYDPYGASGVPFRAVRDLVMLGRVDAMINFPWYDVQVHGVGAVKHAQAAEAARLGQFDALYGGDEWRLPALQLAESEREEALVTLYHQALQAITSHRHDPRDRLTVKRLGLRHADRERTLYCLFLVTHDPIGALAMNGVIEEAGWAERLARWHCNQERQLHFFGALPDMAPRPEARALEVPMVATRVWRAAGAGPVQRRELVRRLAQTDLHLGDIDRALRYLRQQGNARFDGDLRHETTIIFKAPPEDPPLAIASARPA